VLGACAVAVTAAEIPATPLMTVYQFNGPAAVPYYETDRFLREGPVAPAGSLTQGTSVVPCLVIRGGVPVTDGQGTPYVGFDVVVEANGATVASTARFTEAFERRKAMSVDHHHCADGIKHVIDVRRLFALGKPPRFDPPTPESYPPRDARGAIDEIVRAFHISRYCTAANRRLVGRREMLERAWTGFVTEHASRWPRAHLERARHLDIVMRTTLYEGHLDRGCNSYGACERNVIALSIRNRGIERCLRGQGCREPGDFEGVAATVSQYNIWDEYLTQTSGLTSCFLRPDLSEQSPYARLQAMYEQSAPDVERILFGTAGDLATVFPGVPTAQLTRLRHYYHPPAMGKCFPNHPRMEYMSGAVAKSGNRFALIADTRIQVGERRGDGYAFQLAEIDAENDRDIVRLSDRYTGFSIDSRKVALAAPRGCTPYGTSRACRFDSVGRFRKTPSWLASGELLQLTCRVRAAGEDCRAEPVPQTAKVGGTCDTWMQPVAGVP
jgi:hypothetical protein